MALNATTESIDVGSMFLMDMSVNEADLLEQQQQQQHTATDGHQSFSSNQSRPQVNDQSCLIGEQISFNKGASKQQLLQHRISETTTNSTDLATQRTSTVPFNQESSKVSPFYMNECQSLSSISDESFVASYGDGLSLTASSFGPEVDEERASTATREDSGVLDMKDLEGQLYASYDDDKEATKHEQAREENGQKQQRITHQNKGKPISQNLTATNLINRSSAGKDNNLTDERACTAANSIAATADRPTTDINQYNRQTTSSSASASNPGRTVSASLPIQVPVRQMKKDLNKLKLGMINKAEAELAAANGHQHRMAMDLSADPQPEQRMSITSKRRNQARPAAQAIQYRSYTATDATAATADDFDQFLEQEYNDNHHNHYPLDEFDEEHLSAEDNPMKLFERIQALARSLHEDAELFGSLPPKRMLGSPIRSLGLV